MPRPAIVHAILARLRNLSLPQALQTLLGLMLVRGALQARITIGLVEELRQRLLSHVLHAPSLNLQQLGRGGSDRAADGRYLQQCAGPRAGHPWPAGLLCLGLLDAGVLAVGRGATRAAANTAQRCPATDVGDGLHGVRAVPAAGGET